MEKSGGEWWRVVESSGGEYRSLWCIKGILFQAFLDPKTCHVVTFTSFSSIYYLNVLRVLILQNL